MNETYSKMKGFAEQGDKVAQFMLGCMLKLGEGVNKT